MTHLPKPYVETQAPGYKEAIVGRVENNWNRFDRTRRYVVTSVFNNGDDTTSVIVYSGNNLDRALQTCEFWDERQPTYFRDTTAPLGVEAKWIDLFDRIQNDPLYGQRD